LNLTFDIAWELIPPQDGTYINSKIPPDAVEDFFGILTRAANRTGDAEEVYYTIRAAFSEAMGLPVYRSSSMYFAAGDARTAMERAAENAPVFISAFYGTCKQIKKQFGTKMAPSVPVMNRLLDMHRLGYVIAPPNLALREQVEVVPVRSSTVLQQAQVRFRDAIERSRQLLEEDKGDEAVTQIWWLLESIVLSFSGCNMNGQEIGGTYFNEVSKSLKRGAGDAAVMGAVARWLEALQSYLSGPGEAGIRHGRHLHMEGLKRHEAELFCNLTRSYISYLLSEYEILTASRSVESS
jgi:hypothetical protein